MEQIMKYIETVKKLLNETESSGNALEHELCEIINEVNSKGVCTRDFVIMNNAYFRLFDDFKSDWKNEMKKFSLEFGIDFSLIDAGNTIEFRKKLP